MAMLPVGVTVLDLYYKEPNVLYYDEDARLVIYEHDTINTFNSDIRLIRMMNYVLLYDPKIQAFSAIKDRTGSMIELRAILNDLLGVTFDINNDMFVFTSDEDKTALKLKGII